MAGITVATHRSAATAAFSSRGLHAALAVGALLVMALVAALFLVMPPQSQQPAPQRLTGDQYNNQFQLGLPADTHPAVELVQQDRPTGQPTEFIYRTGEPY
jgi:hypothetical protein